MNTIAYDRINADIAALSAEEQVAFLMDVLPDEWCEAYESGVVAAKPNFIDIGSFCVIFDLTTWLPQPETGPVVYQDDRVIAIYGRSCPPQAARDTARMRGYLGKTYEVFGHGYDKGHFIAHTLGGDILDTVNWFQQERRLNRGWSAEGKIYRDMERYGAANPGTFVFARPIYGDLTMRPDSLEFGILRDGRLEVRTFDNRPDADFTASS